MLFAPIAFLSVVGAGSAALLYLIAKKFYVEEDPRIDQEPTPCLVPTAVLVVFQGARALPKRA